MAIHERLKLPVAQRKNWKHEMICYLQSHNVTHLIRQAVKRTQSIGTSAVGLTLRTLYQWLWSQYRLSAMVNGRVASKAFVFGQRTSLNGDDVGLSESYIESDRLSLGWLNN